MNDGDFFAGVFGGLLMGAMLFLPIGATIGPSDEEKAGIVCEYEGGTLKDDVCIKDDKVIDLG